jgi:hypothetical protein
MSRRTPRFFLRRFKRSKHNPYVSASGYTAGGAFVGKPAVYGKSKADIAEKLAAQGLEVSSMHAVRKSGASIRRRRKHRKTHTKARRATRTTMVTRRKSRRSLKARLAAARREGAIIGRVFKRSIGKKHFALKVLAVRKGRGKKRKVNAVRWSGKKGSKIYTALSFGSRRRKGTHVIGFTNPRKRRSKRRASRRNPGVVAGYVGGLTSAPTKIMSIFKGKDMIKNVAFTAGGAVGTFMLGGIISSKVIKPALEKFAPGFAAKVADPSTIEARVVGGLLPYTAAFAATKLFGKQLGGDLSTSLLVGGAVASIVELIRPGMVGDLLKKTGLGQLPYAGPALAGLGALSGPVCGLGYGDMLAGYVEAPSYAGTAGYVEAPSYAGTAGYVEAPSYAGTAGLGQEQLAGTFLDDASSNMLENNWL